jgi:MFS family permease
MTHSSPTTSLDGCERFFVLLCVSVPSFMINLDANIVAVSLPSIARSLNADFAAIEWVVSAYTLTFASLVMMAGALADRYGRKRLLIIGLAIFSVASLVCGVDAGLFLPCTDLALDAKMDWPARRDQSPPARAVSDRK